MFVNKVSNTVNPEKTEDLQPGHLDAAVEDLEKKLRQLETTRSETQNELRKCQAEQSRLFRDCPSRPRETVEEMNKRIGNLERERTIVSMPLAEEKQILKQIHKLERTKREAQHFLEFDAKIKATKSSNTKMREKLQELNQSISSTLVELSTLRTANHVGCRVEDLLGMKVACPQDKIGKVIGKHGKNVKQIAEAAKVTVDVEKKSTGDGHVRLVGSVTSLDQALLDLERVISKTEEVVSVPSPMIEYWTAKSVAALPDIRKCHPDVYFDVDKSRPDSILLRGIPSDIARAKDDLMSTEIVDKVLEVTNKEASFIVGKQGSTIESLVISHQTAIDVKRGENVSASSTIRVVGPVGNVESAVREIQGMIEANREVETEVPITTYTKSCLLIGSGTGIQALSKKVNEKLSNLSAGYIGVNFGTNAILTIKSKARVHDEAVEIVEAEIRRLESLAVKLTVDPVVIPVLIGKGGQTLKSLKGDMANVNIEFIRDEGKVVICGLDGNEIEAVAVTVKEKIAQHEVLRIGLDKTTYKTQIRELLTRNSKEINALVTLVTDDDKAELMLRGSAENIAKASEIVNSFVESNYTDEVEMAGDDMSALLTGGKESKIVELSEKHGVKIHADRPNMKVQIRGTKKRVEDAAIGIHEFLYGGDGISLERFALPQDSMRSVIGKGGKNKDELQKRYPNVSLIFHRNENVVSLRGPKEDVESCQRAILKQVSTTQTTKALQLDKTQIARLENTKAHRRIMQSLPVVIILKETTVTLRGLRDDVLYGEALINEHLNGKLCTSFFLEKTVFERLKQASRDQVVFQGNSDADVVFDEGNAAITFSGSRNAVEATKLEVVKMMDFVLGSRFARIELDEGAVRQIGKAGAITDVSFEFGVHGFLDREINSILLFGSDPESLEGSKQVLLSRVEVGKKQLHIIQLAESEDWIVSAILGKNGVRIKSLRKELQCRVDVDSQLRRVTISSQDEDRMTKARSLIEDIVSSARKECVFLSISDREMPAFVGKAGKHIKQFEKEHGVQVQVYKTTKSNLRITGKEDQVENARKAVAEWLAVREDKRREEDASVSVSLTRDQIPGVIGEKGTVIRKLERTFGCKIDIDRKASLVSVKGARRQDALNEIVRITSTPMDGSREGSSIEADGKDQSRKEGSTAVFEKSKTGEPVEPTECGLSIEEGDFPSLSTTDDAPSSAESPSPDNDSPSWASKLVKPQTSE